uniref:Uncharacterized protein n=1 Tax=Amorphochlora amoebiformis TaxID=1561963 RepID=A0A7S0GRT2_9EUKA
MRTQRKRPMLAIQKGVQKRGRGTRESPENRTPRAKNGVPVHIRNALSADYVHVTSEEASDWQLIVHKVKSVYSNHDIVFLDEWGVIDGKDCKVANSRNIRFVTRAGISQAWQRVLHLEEVSPELLQILGFVSRHFRSVDHKQVLRTREALARCSNLEKQLRDKLSAIATEVNGIQYENADTLVYTDFSHLKGHVLVRCIRSLQSRLRILLKEVRVHKGNVSRAEERYKESVRFMRAYSSLNSKMVEQPFNL